MDLLNHLKSIYDQVSAFQPTISRPPILDTEEADDSAFIPGLRKLKDDLKIDIDAIQKFLDDTKSVDCPLPSTNAPYLISVWHELLCAPPPVISIFKLFLFEPTDLRPSAQRRKTGVKPQGAKVDIVADNGKTWIRINTIKNSRLLAEFREIDSYLTDSSDDEGDSLRPTTFDSSILKMGRALVQAAHSNPIQGTTTPPKVIMRLTRLEPDAPSADPRISQTLDLLKDMGIDVQLGERSQSELDASSHTHPTPQTTPTLIPSHRINLDLSVLIALISDLTHAPLPVSVEAAHKRFIPPKEYREWKQSKRQQANKASSMSIEPEELTISDLPHDLATHARALTHQLLNEMCRSLIQYIHSQIRPDTEFWVTKEARDRCLRIVSKIGAVNEKRRAYALFLLDPSDSSPIPIDCAEQLFWQNSRYSPGILPLFPLYFHDETLASSTEWEKTRAELLQARPSRHTFFKDREGTCQWILDQEATADPCPMPTTEPRISSNTDLPRAPLTKTNPRLTTHTVTSLLCGARLGWTTLTANRTSIKAIMKEVRARGGARALSSGQEREGENLKESEDVKAQQQTFQEAAIWIIDPRSLAEQMAGGQA